MKQRTRLLSALLTLVMVLGLVPAMSLTANAYSGAGTKSSPYVVTDYDELRELMKNVKWNDPTCYIKLGSDITECGSRNRYSLYVQNGGNVVLDLAGYSLTRSALTTDSRLIGVEGGSLTINDSVGGGEIAFKTQSGGYGYSGTGIFVWDGSKLTVNGGTIVGGEYGIYTQGGTTVINGGTFLSLNPESNLYMISKPGYFYRGTVAVCGGTFGDSASNYTTIAIKDADVTFYNSCTAYYGMYSGDYLWPSLKGVTVTVDGKKARPQGNFFMGNSVEGRVGAKIVISGPDKPIDTVEITGIDAPVTGQPLDFTADCDTVGVKSVSVYWYNLSDKKTVSKGEVAKGGKTYRVDVDLLPQTGYQFVGDKSEAVTINGEEAYIFGGTTEDLSVSYTFSETAAAKKAISAVAITNLDALKHGQAADYNASTSTPGCTVEKVEYQMFRKTLTDYVPSDGDNVAVVVTVSAADGYAFASGSTATWNGLTSDDTVAGLNANEKRYAFYIEVGADASQIVKSAAMTVTAPQIGKAPAATVTAPQGVTVESVDWTPADSAFKEGVSYTVKIGFQADSTHILADDFLNTGTVTINGQSAQLSKPTTGGIKDTFLTTCYASFTFPALKAGEQPVSPDRINPFTDVKESNYFYEPVLWAVEKEITNGTSATTFSPERTCTRAQIITFLWRASGSPEPGITCSFLDVPAGSYYEKAVVWATEQGMVEGDKFYPNAPCTRLMAVEFMWIQSGKPDAPAASFEDVNSPAVDWAVEAGVTNGTSATKFSPDSTCTRGQIVTFLWRAFG